MLAPYGIDPADKLARTKFRDAVLQENLQTLGVDQPSSSGQAPARPTFAPDGRQIKYGPDGTPYVKGPNGQPVPYVPTSDTSDGSQMSGLAMDQAAGSDDFQNAGIDQGGEQDYGDQTADSQSPGLLSQTGMSDDEQDDTQDDSDQYSLSQGLLGGSYG